MARTIVGLLMLLALGLAPASAADPRRRTVVPAPSAIPLPTRITAACGKATGELAYVCDEYARLYRQTEIARFEALRKLELMTYGGVAELLE